MSSMACRITPMPVMERYAGDTTPIVIYPKNQDGTRMLYEDLSGAACKFSLKSSRNETSTPDFAKTGVLSEDGTTGYALFTFSFIQSETLSLLGHYLYEIDITMTVEGVSERRVGQGTFIVRENILGVISNA